MEEIWKNVVTKEVPSVNEMELRSVLNQNCTGSSLCFSSLDTNVSNSSCTSENGVINTMNIQNVDEIQHRSLGDIKVSPKSVTNNTSSYSPDSDKVTATDINTCCLDFSPVSPNSSPNTNKKENDDSVLFLLNLSTPRTQFSGSPLLCVNTPAYRNMDEVNIHDLSNEPDIISIHTEPSNANSDAATKLSFVTSDNDTNNSVSYSPHSHNEDGFENSIEYSHTSINLTDGPNSPANTSSPCNVAQKQIEVQESSDEDSDEKLEQSKS